MLSIACSRHSDTVNIFGPFRLADRGQRAQHLSNDRKSLLSVPGCNIEIEHGTHGIGTGRQHIDAAPVRFLDEVRCVQVLQLETDDTGLHGRRIDGAPLKLRKPLSEALRSPMSFTQALAMMPQRVERTRRDDPGLAEAAADLLLEPPRPGDEILWSGKARSKSRSIPIFRTSTVGRSPSFRRFWLMRRHARRLSKSSVRSLIGSKSAPKQPTGAYYVLTGSCIAEGF